MCHGLGEHCQWYDPLAKEYTEKGILVFSHDHGMHIIRHFVCILMWETGFERGIDISDEGVLTVA